MHVSTSEKTVCVCKNDSRIFKYNLQKSHFKTKTTLFAKSPTIPYETV